MVGKDLQKPKSHEGSFEWPAYLARVGAVPAPGALLSSPTNSSLPPMPPMPPMLAFMASAGITSAPSRVTGRAALRGAAEKVLQLAGQLCAASTSSPARAAATLLRQLTTVPEAECSTPTPMVVYTLPRSRSVASERKDAIRSLLQVICFFWEGGGGLGGWVGGGGAEEGGSISTPY